MLRATREALETYASGVGIPAAEVIREFKKLPEAQKFDVLARIKELEKLHQAYVANGNKMPAPTEPPPAPQIDLAAVARERRDDYARQRLLSRQSLIVGRDGRPLRRDP